MNLDSDQQKAYLADINAVVSAGAGSGKTRVLAERYVRLVTERGYKVHEVLTLTFTRKAASEMRERIFKRLTESSHPLAGEALAQFDKARISTMDAFCAGLVRGASNRYGLSGDFRVDDAEMSRIAKETAVELVMNGRREKALYRALSRLVSARSFEIVINKLFADIAMESFSLVKAGAYAVSAQKQVDFIQKETQRRCETINNYCDAVLSIDDSKCKSDTPKKAKNAARKSFTLPLVLETQTTPDETLSEGVDPKTKVRTLIEKAEFFASQTAFPSIKSTVKDETLKELKVLTDAARKNAKELVVLAKTLLFREDILAIGQLLDEYEAEYLSRKRQTGLVSFRDALEMAIDVLKSDTKLRSFYKKNIKSIMIDEFQDNNEQQKNLLYLLAERDDVQTVNAVPESVNLAPDKLFFVGDEKQSIYRFRGADVAVFRKLSQELKEGLPQELREQFYDVSLNTNYRSTPELVDFFNAIFPSVFGIATEDYEAEFSPIRSDPSKEHAKTKSSTGYVPVEIFLREKGESEDISDETSEAFACAERIVDGVLSGEFRLGDVAVLFKTTTRQNEYERVFRQAGIPFTASDPRGVYADGLANDFYAFLRLALFPLDKNAYATVLRSPFVNLDDEAVFTLLLEMGADSSIEKKPFPDTPALSLSLAEKARYEHGKTVFAELCRRIDLESLASILSYLWFETGYRTWLLYRRESRPALGHFDYLYSLALNADRRQLNASAFLDELAPLIGSAEKIQTGEAPKVDNEVLFLTVHKSKGLEFPVVVLADAGGIGKGERNDKPYYLSSQWGPIVNLKMDVERRKEPSVNYFYSMLQETIKQQEEAEIKRQFYVAATRAEKYLFIFGTRKVSKKEEQELAGLDTIERLSELAALPRNNAQYEPQKKSFLDLLAIGLAPRKSEQHMVFPFFPPLPSPSSDDSESDFSPSYTERMRILKEKTERLIESIEKEGKKREMKKTKEDSAPLRPEDFYAKESPPLKEASTLSVEPTAIETVGGGNWRIGTPRDGAIWGERLSDFKNNDFLGKKEERSKDFGTLCHHLIGKRFIGEVFEGTAFRAARSLFPDASREERQALADEALALTSAFFSSHLGTEAFLARRRYSEHAFILPLADENGKTILIKGQIDLIYEHKGRCVILDFKTDREIRPENHRFQLACYRAAAGAFSDLPPKTGLVYLRNMSVVFFDPAVSTEELLETAKASLAQ
ncbi:MAG: UvrD-helicase domain-containing protein [Treponema sp.]|jgi:ATP-dependent helicase/nuclease subunit A|nr:UvrD-helicase domain-containing protein [Treponema sp.]